VNGIAHLAVALCFVATMVFLDLDHLGSCSLKEIGKAFNGEQNECSRGFLHNPLIFWCLLVLVIGLFIHLKMDGIL